MAAKTNDFQILDITVDSDDTIYRAKAGNLNIRCTFHGDISDDAAKEFSRVFHSVMKRAAIDRAAAGNDAEITEHSA